ncbi:MAG: hypothetical protein J6Y89_02400, partial [Lachnospiraceae bacterium]|nr:hypothetical protein [Lachnospiraceae bacterium]
MNSQKRTKIFRKQYHPAFCCAAELDFSEDRENLMYREEFILNTAPNRIDLLVIKKESGVVLKNNIGAIFQKYNILEYKSPKDGRMLNAYYITNAYANLLIGYSLGPKSFDDVTVTFIRNSMPQKLMEFFRDNGYTICKYAAGIYHVTKAS